MEKKHIGEQKPIIQGGQRPNGKPPKNNPNSPTASPNQPNANPLKPQETKKGFDGKGMKRR